MRQNHGSKRSRGRGSGRRSGPSQNRTYDSNGPSVRIRGNAFQVHEKYLALARDAASAGDPIAAENYLQHAEHYYRIMAVQREEAEARGGNQPRGGNGRRNPNRDDDSEELGSGGVDVQGGESSGDDAEEMPAFVTRKTPTPPREDDSDDESENEPETAVGD